MSNFKINTESYIILRYLPTADRFKTHCITLLIYCCTPHARENSIHILGGTISSISEDGGQGKRMYTENDPEEKRNWLFLQGLKRKRCNIDISMALWYLKNIQIFKSECILTEKIWRVNCSISINKNVEFIILFQRHHANIKFKNNINVMYNSRNLCKGMYIYKFLISYFNKKECFYTIWIFLNRDHEPWTIIIQCANDNIPTRMRWVIMSIKNARSAGNIINEVFILLDK